MIGRDLHHVSINVDDLDAARAFYVDALGLRELDRPDLGFPGAWLAVGDRQIHLLELPATSVPGPHFAIQVDDLDTAIASLREAGIDVGAPRGIEGVCRQAFLDDPAGNQVELNQPL